MKNLKGGRKLLALVGILTGVIVMMVIVRIQVSHVRSEISAQTQVFSSQWSLEKNFLASSMLTLDSQTSGASYETSHEFLSEITRPEISFTSVGMIWNEFAPRGTSIGFEIRFQQNGRWSEWYPVPYDGDHKNVYGEYDQQLGLQSAFLPINMSQAYQYRVTLMGDGSATPIISNISITAINAKAGATTRSHISAEITQDMIPHDRIKVIPRSEWGADESLRVYRGSEAIPPTVKLDAEYTDKFSDELQIVKKITTNEKGELLTWPLEYPEKVTKIIVHHTASTANLDNPKQAIRDIAYWHTKGRGWGDIGYNYIIDPVGNIYEGRYGGEKVVGAHAGKSNTGAIGISVMGNYETGDVSDASLVALARLTSEKTKIHGIDPLGKSIFRGEMSNNILGHRDVMSTTCPGKNLYDKLPLVAQLAKTKLSTTVEEPNFSKQKDTGLDFEDESGILYLSLDPEVEKSIPITIRNTGTIPWDAKTSLVINDFDTLKDYIQVMPPPSRITFPMDTPKSVSPGESATFTVKLAGGFKSALKTLRIVPLINGKTKLRKYIGLSVQSTPAIFAYELVGSLLPPPAMKSNEKFAAWIDLKNTGNVNWQNSGNKNVKLGTDHPRDQVSKFTTPASARIGALQQSIVRPGEVGRFKVNLKAPNINDTITQVVTPVVEGVTWMADTNLTLKTFVYEKNLAALPVGANFLKAPAGTTQTVTIRMKNIGGQTWSKSNPAQVPQFKKSNSARAKLISASMVEDSIAPGEIAAFTLQLELPKIFSADKLRLDAYIGKVKMNKTPITISIKKEGPTRATTISTIPSANTTNSQTSTISTSSLIRVRIGYEDARPIISASEAFQLMSDAPSDKDAIHIFAPNEKVSVTASSTSSTTSYLITSPTFSKTITTPPRFTAVSPTGILRIDNFQRRPAWDQTLNDNEFRGILEVRADGAPGSSAINVINELNIEDYLKGLAETPNGEPMEKKKAIIIAARTYAVYYSTVGKGKKFPGKPYDLDDDPDHTQKYRGYGVEKRSPNSVKSVEETRGIIIRYLGKTVLAPYFSSSNGRTLSAREAFGWEDAAYLPSVDDPYCAGQKQWGHGVGMSGCGALGMAKNGKSYEEILKYYYKGISLEKLY